MRIKSLCLERYKRYSLGEHDSMYAVYSSPVQLILGSNGSGKSSTKDRLVPECPPSSAFDEGGKFEQVSEHDGSEYTLRAIKGARSFTYEFEKDGVLLHSGVRAIQQDLINEHFGKAANVFPLLIGKTRFTNMPAGKIMDLLMLLSDLNLDDGMAAWRRVSKITTDAATSLRLYTNQYDEVTKQIMPQESIEALRSQQDKLQAEHHALLAAIPPRQHHCELTVDAIDKRIAETESKIAGILRNLRRHSPGPVKSPEYDTIDEEIDTLRREGGRLQETTANLYRELDKQQRHLEQLRRIAPGASEETLCKEIDSIDKELYTRQSVTRITDKHDLNRRLVEVSQLETAVREMRVNSLASRWYTNEEIDAHENMWCQCKTSVVQSEAMLERIIADLTSDDVKRTHWITCNNCQSKIHDDDVMSDEKRHALEKKREVLPAIINDAKVKLEEHTAIMEDIEKHRDNIRYFNTYFSHGGSVFRSDYDNGLRVTAYRIITEGDILLSELTERIKDLENDIRVVDLTAHRARLNGALEIVRTHRSFDTVDIATLNETLNETNEKLSKIEARIRKLEGVKTTLKLFEKSEIEIDALYSAIEVLLQNKAERIYSDIAYQRMAEVVEEHMRVKDVLQKQEVLLDRKTDLASRIETAKVKLKDLRLMESSMSPRIGIISEYMLQFLTSFFEEVNGVIAQIFSMPLTINVQQSNEGALEYKFMIYVNGVPTSYINDGSTGQKDVIDLAVNISIIKFLGYTGFPLYLDETGTTFDDTHKTNLLEFVKDMIETGEVSQVFMISHTESIHGGFSDYETTVLHAANLVNIPSNSNAHVKFY